MKMKNIAKISLLLGILATGVNTTTEKPVYAEKKPIVISENSKKLKKLIIINLVLNIKM